jgi:hypothetical protein
MDNEHESPRTVVRERKLTKKPALKEAQTDFVTIIDQTDEPHDQNDTIVEQIVIKPVENQLRIKRYWDKKGSETLPTVENDERLLVTEIRGISPSWQLKDFTFSVSTNLIYLLYGNEEKTKLYEIDIMKNRRQIAQQFQHVEKVITHPTESVLFLESGGDIYQLHSQQSTLVQSGAKLAAYIQNQGLYYTRGNVLYRYNESGEQSLFTLPSEQFALTWDGDVIAIDGHEIIRLGQRQQSLGEVDGPYRLAKNGAYIVMKKQDGIEIRTLY